MNSAKIFLSCSAVWLGTCVIAGLMLVSIPGGTKNSSAQHYTSRTIQNRLAPISKTNQPSAQTQTRVKINGADALITTRVTILR